MDVAAIILTHNEEIHIRRAIQSARQICSEIFVVDSHSSDRTVSIAEDEGAVVFQRPFINYADQFQWALDNVPSTASWILRLDADEIVDASLADEVRSRLPSLGGDVAGVSVRLRHVFLGRQIKHGGRTLRLLRLFRRGRGRIEQRFMDEHIIVPAGAVAKFSGLIIDHNLKGIGFFTNKHNSYANREAIDTLCKRWGLASRGEMSKDASGVKAAGVRWAKDNIYSRIPGTLGPWLYFFYRYVVRLGFLDGKEGALFHLFQGLWYRMLVAIKLDEIERAVSQDLTTNDLLTRLESASGVQVRSFLGREVGSVQVDRLT